MNRFLQQIGFSRPIIQAPMAGISTPEMVAAVSNAGGLGSLGVGNLNADRARAQIRATRALTDKPFNVNLFCHRPATLDSIRDAAWIEWLAPHFAKFGGQPPAKLQEIYTSFVEDEAMLTMLLEERPKVVSFHFGLPPAASIAALKAADTVLLATATNLDEARLIVTAGIDAIVAQGYEAGGHRGQFDLTAPDECLGTIALTRLLVRKIKLPIVASGGIMDGAGIAACLMLGASAAQLGTAFVTCTESAADAGYRAAFQNPASLQTVITTAISGRPARCLRNKFTDLGVSAKGVPLPDYPTAYDVGKALNATAKSAGEAGYGAHWAGQAAALARNLPAALLVAQLHSELQQALTQNQG
jgi:nitronate monooxygenase